MANAKVNPIIMTYEGKEYTLEFNRESAVFINSRGFKPSEFFDNLEEMLPILFYGAFRMHHKDVSRSMSDKILLEKANGLSTEVVNRLMELYAAPRNALIRDDDPADSKNAEVTFTL